MRLDALHALFSLPGMAITLPFRPSAPPRFMEKPSRFGSFNKLGKEPM
jgi:hypothetical protein